MDSAILDFVSATFGIALSAALALFGIAFWLTHWITKKVTQINDKHSHLDGSMSKIESNIDTIRQDIAYLKGMSEVQFVKRPQRNADRLSIKHSPRKLNELGQQIYSDLKGEVFLTTNKDFLYSLIDNRKPTTPYDVEVAASLALISSTSNSMFNGIKEFIYNAPAYEYKDKDGNKSTFDLSLSDACFVLSLPLRDMYLSDHAEIK